MKATKILIIYSLIFILLNSTIVLAEQRNGIYEPLDYLNDNTPLSIAIPSSNAWKTEIAASEINSEWNDNDEFSIVNFDNADMSFDNNNVLTMTFNNVDYENGNLVVLLFHNKTKDEYSALQIDFSETGIPTFQSEIQRDRVMKNSLSRSGSIIVDDNIPDGVNDAKQEYNKNVEPPMDIVLADSRGAEYNPVPYTDAGSRRSTTTSSAGMKTFYSSPIVQSTLVNGEYRPKHDIYLYYTYGDGTVYCQVQNVITGVAQEGYVDDYRFNTSAPNICLMTGTSLVPDIYDSTGTQTAGDIKCGAYLKNVIWSENKIYKQSLWKGTAYSFAGNNSSTTNYLLTYDRDNASCTATSDRDTINIF